MPPLGQKKQEFLFFVIFFFMLTACAASRPPVVRPARFPSGSGDAANETYRYNYEDSLGENAAGARSGFLNTAEMPVIDVAAEIRALVEAGSPSSFRQAIVLIRQNNAQSVEYGRVMGSLALTMLNKVYDDRADLGMRVDFPQMHKYSKIIRDAEAGRYTAAALSSNDYLELTLPFLALLNENQMSRLSAAIPDLERAKRINPQGALAHYFLGLIYERMPRFDSAADEYKQALALAPDCYAATLGLVRIMSADGWQNDAVNLLLDLERRYPDNSTVKRQLIYIYIYEKQFDKALAVIQQGLEQNSRDAGLLLMQAYYFIERGQAMQAQFPLDAYIQNNKENADYLLLRARVAAEGYNNRTNALSILRPLLRNYPDNITIRVYTIKILLESTNESENAEGKAMLSNVLKGNTQGYIAPELIELALQDAVRRSAWEEAKQYRDQIPAERRGSQELLHSYEIEQGLGNNRQALSYARQMREKYPDNEEGSIAYTNALIEAGRKDEAERIINERLAQIGTGSFKSRYYYLRSRLQSGGEAALADLRSALFENPRNLDAILAMFEIYDKRGDERRAVYYLKQAIALAPTYSAVKNYEKKYAGKL